MIFAIMPCTSCFPVALSGSPNGNLPAKTTRGNQVGVPLPRSSLNDHMIQKGNPSVTNMPSQRIAIMCLFGANRYKGFADKRS